jgi:hypothetical protein
MSLNPQMCFKHQHDFTLPDAGNTKKHFAAITYSINFVHSIANYILK